MRGDSTERPRRLGCKRAAGFVLPREVGQVSGTRPRTARWARKMVGRYQRQADSTDSRGLWSEFLRRFGDKTDRRRCGSGKTISVVVRGGLLTGEAPAGSGD